MSDEREGVLRERAERAEAALRAVEWGPAPISPNSECPYCLREKRHGHATECLISKALNR